MPLLGTYRICFLSYLSAYSACQRPSVLALTRNVTQHRYISTLQPLIGVLQLLIGVLSRSIHPH